MGTAFFDMFFNTVIGNIVLASVVSSIISVYLRDKHFVVWKYYPKDKALLTLVKSVVNAIVIALIIILFLGIITMAIDKLTA